MYDVVVVGAGPAGCHTAALLSQRGFDVHLLEEHPVIGEPVDCSGVIGAEALTTLELPEFLRLGEIRTLTLVSPSQLEVRFAPPSPLAYIVDRAAFDRTIAEKASRSGATFHLGSRVVDLSVLEECVEVEVVNGHSPAGKVRKTVQASMVILAGGPRYGIQRKLGMGQPGDFLRTAQAEFPVQGVKEAKVLMGSSVAPGSYGWIVPFRRGDQEVARIGVSAKTCPIPYLRKLINHLYDAGCLSSPNVPVRSWVIPITPLPRTFADRVLAVGDAAGQTKPTTGGGIYYGLLCAEAAAHSAVTAFERGDFRLGTLSSYEEKWRKKLGREIRTAAFFRGLAERLTDKDLDDLFRVVRSNGILSAVTSKARFDWHGEVIRFALTHPGLGRIFLKSMFG